MFGYNVMGTELPFEQSMGRQDRAFNEKKAKFQLSDDANNAAIDEGLKQSNKHFFANVRQLRAI